MPDIAILDSRRLPWPVPWSDLFGRKAPLWMEIGFGNGKFLVEMAGKYPEVNLIGVEISQTSLRKAAHAAERQELENIRLIYGNAEGVLLALCRPHSLEQVTVNFPDPWPKAAHHHRRLINRHFLALLATRMPPGAPLDIATDHPDYAEWIEEHLLQTPYFESRMEQTYLTSDPSRLQTKYELKGLGEGRPPRYFKWRRNDTLPEHPFPIPKEFSMPHIVLQSPLTLADIQRCFEPATFSEEEVVVRFVDLLQSPSGDLLLVDTHIEEEPFAQRVGLTLRARPEKGGEIILSLHEIGFPRPTRGVHMAVAFLADYLQTLDLDIIVLRSNVSEMKP